MSLEYRVRFGSADSVDVDVAYVVSALPTLEACKQLCRSDSENRNLIVVSEGQVVDCFKGAPDETNNAIFATYGLHAQERANPIAAPVTRIVPLKIVRATRTILSLLSRGPERARIKAALRAHDQHLRLCTLAELSLAGPHTTVDQRKSIAFQLGQSLALVHGSELYTKREIAAEFPSLRPFLDRCEVDPEQASALEDARDDLVAALDEVYVRRQGTLNLFCYKNSVTVREWNLYCVQSRGVIIDMARERCVCFPYAKFFKLGEQPGWTHEELVGPAGSPGREPSEIVDKIDGSFVSAYRHEGAVHFACKGNFDVEQAREAARIAQRYDFEALDFSRYYFTLEVVYPGNRFPSGFASVDYGERALFLTGARERRSHAMLPYAEITRMAEQSGLRSPARFEGTLAEALALTRDDRWHNHEGWVANFGGKRVKIKRSSYMRINDILNGLKHGNSRVLKKYLRMSEAEWSAYVEILPPEFQAHVDAEISFYEGKRDELLGLVDGLIHARHERAAPRIFIDFVLARVDPAYHKIAFRRMRGHDCEGLLRSLALERIFDSGRKIETVAWGLVRASS